LNRSKGTVHCSAVTGISVFFNEVCSLSGFTNFQLFYLSDAQPVVGVRNIDAIPSFNLTFSLYGIQLLIYSTHFASAAAAGILLLEWVDLSLDSTTAASTDFACLHLSHVAFSFLVIICCA
jgi:hypothetical protein